MGLTFPLSPDNCLSGRDGSGEEGPKTLQDFPDSLPTTGWWSPFLLSRQNNNQLDWHQVTMGRKISGGRRKLEEEEEDALRDPFLEQSLKIPQDFISEMKEAFRYFDKVKHSG